MCGVKKRATFTKILRPNDVSDRAPVYIGSGDVTGTCFAPVVKSYKQMDDTIILNGSKVIK